MKESLAQDQSSPAEESSSGSPEPAREARTASADSLEVSSDEIAVGPYTDDGEDDDDVVTLQMDAPLDDGEWMVQTSAHDRRRMSTAQLSVERETGTLPPTARVWRNGMGAWTPLAEVDLSAPVGDAASPVEPASSVARPVVPPPAAPPAKRTVPAIPSPPPPRLAPSPSRPLASPAPTARATGRVATGSAARALGSSPAASSPAAARSLGVSPPPPRIEARPRPERASSVADADEFASSPLPAASTPPAQRVDTATSVALDVVGPAVGKRSSPWRGLFAQGAAAALALLGTSYGLIRAGVFEPGTSSSATASPVMHAEPSAVAASTSTLALQPAAPAAEAKSNEPAALPPAALPPAALPPAALPPAAETAAAPPSALAAPESTEAVPSGAEKAAASSSDSKKEEPAQGEAATKEESSPKDEGVAKDEAAAKEGAPGSRDPARSGAEDRAARRARWAARRAAAAEAKHQRRAVPETNRVEPEREPPAPAQEPGSTFDRQAAQAALTAAAEQAKNCRPMGGPSGTGTVQVTYEPSGKVASVTIVTAGFENSEAAGCIQMLFRRAKVPAFNGAKTAVMRQRFDIP